MRTFIVILLLAFSGFSYSQEKVIFDNQLCFYNDENKQEPSRFVYHNKRTNDYVFSFVEENEKERILEKTKNNTIVRDGVKYSIGKKMITTDMIDYYEICLIK
jgi:hypothetical protein